MKPINQLTPADIKEFILKVDKKTWIKIAAISIGTIVVLFLIVIPAWIDRISIKAQVNEVKNQLTTTQNLLRRQPELLKNKEKFLAENQAVKERLYEPAETALLLGTISKLAQESKVSIVTSTPKKFDAKFTPPFDAQYEASAYDFTVEGGYHDLAGFVSKIENNPKILRIQGFHVEPQEKTKDKHLVHLSLTAVSKKKKL